MGQSNSNPSKQPAAAPPNIADAVSAALHKAEHEHGLALDDEGVYSFRGIVRSAASGAARTAAYAAGESSSGTFSSSGKVFNRGDGWDFESIQEALRVIPVLYNKVCIGIRALRFSRAVAFCSRSCLELLTISFKSGKVPGRLGNSSNQPLNQHP